MIQVVFKNLSQGPAPFWKGQMPAVPRIGETPELLEFNRVKVIKIIWRETTSTVWSCEIHTVSDLARV